MSLSWPPPCSTGTGWASLASSSAPAPTGPPSLCPVIVSASAPLSANCTGTSAAACTASVCSGIRCSAQTAASSAIGAIVPTSLFAHITLTSATLSGSGPIVSRRLSADTIPVPSTPIQPISAPSWLASQPAESSTAWCSVAGISTRWRRGPPARRAQNRPFTARLSASVPPLVKITSLGLAPNASAICSLDSSTTRRARRPALCSEEGLPRWASSSVMAAMASGSIGAVAALSR